MLSKGQILRARKAMERFYDGTCTITERQPYKRQNGSTGFRTVDVVTDQPCRLSYSSNFSADKGERASGKEQVIRVFLAPEVKYIRVPELLSFRMAELKYMHRAGSRQCMRLIRRLS